ncbi:hypothetical protein EV421DRAFT_1735538 [Armillaria borealis]|uniref:Uncharacterized protein n=1 Tax=Armillaria borealis TaxID=47425 RepID=A0AA39JJI5_9AGAR|nr:hypothetical protein EV421DRAFT_1735538 [Armillaria borealis]
MMSWNTEIQQFKMGHSSSIRKSSPIYLEFYQSLLLESALAFSTNNDDLTSRKIQSRELESRSQPPTSVHVTPLPNPQFSALIQNENGQLENIIKDLTAKHETAVALARNLTSNTTSGRQDDDHLTPVEYDDDLFNNTASTNRKNKADTSLLLSMKWTERSESYGANLTERESALTKTKCTLWTAWIMFSPTSFGDQS